MQNTNSVPAQPGMFRNPLAPAAAAVLSLASCLGLAALLFFLDPTYPAAITEKILRSGIRTASALNAWTLIHHAITLLCFLGPAVTAAGMWTALSGQQAKGLNFLSNAARWALRLIHVTSAIALACFLYRAALYLSAILRRQDWIYQLFATFVMEGLMVVQAVFLYRLLCRFLDDCEGCAASMGYTLSSGKLDPGTVPAFTATGLMILGILGIILSVDRLVTMTIASDGIKQYYKFIVASHPGQWLCAATLFAGGIGDILLALYVKFYKRTSERAVFYATRKPYA